jgi:hypothetical protein
MKVKTHLDEAEIKQAVACWLTNAFPTSDVIKPENVTLEITKGEFDPRGSTDDSVSAVAAYEAKEERV